MEEIFQEIAKIRSEGGNAALATIVQVKGSTPREVGAKILINGDGTLLGSIGGGTLESTICREAMSVLKQGKAKMLHFDLTGKEGESDQMLCGGEMDIFIEPLLPQPTLYIFGAGHISIPLSKMAKMVGFRVVVIDDRAEYANRERFPEADEVFAEDFSAALSRVRVNVSSYIAIVTRGHQFDETVLKWAVKTEARYIGMIGSKQKNEVIFAHLKSKGISKDILEQVHAPIGLDIGAETPEEIALSIVAELVTIRRQGGHGVKTWKV
jgi:xanthine dehydrogenase accessory factor